MRPSRLAGTLLTDADSLALVGQHTSRPADSFKSWRWVKPIHLCEILMEPFLSVNCMEVHVGCVWVAYVRVRVCLKQAALHHGTTAYLI